MTRHPKPPIPRSKRCAREADEHRDRYLRVAAELDNLRKRSAREVELARKFGAERLAQAILPVRDSLEAGLAAAEKAGREPCSKGSGPRCGYSTKRSRRRHPRDRPEGQPFDPNKHEALSLLPAANVAPNTVLEVVQKGYELNDRLLRAAKVIVARGADA